MIQANELRIGNWVLYTGMDAKGPKDLCRISQLNDQPARGVDGVPLTPELMTGLGFKQANDGQFWMDVFNGCGSIDWDPRGPLTVSYGKGFFRIGNMVHHLHELQNVFFTAFGIEMEIPPSILPVKA